MAHKGALLPGTLEMLILATLRRGPLHGYAIAKRIQDDSEDLLRVEEGSLYPALQRMVLEGWIKAEWSVSGQNRRVRIYTIKAAGRKQLTREVERMGRLMEGVGRVLRLSGA